ncbi:MAG: patatin-like phospholipase family protein [Acidobacteria bacterium]|nr:patatin-like phospholipase family protein [Acidobacteriota bacterium]
MDNQETLLKQTKKSTNKRKNNTCHLDLVESGGGMWKVSSLPAIKYCLESGAKIRRLAGVSGGGLITGLISTGITPVHMYATLPQVHNVNFFDAFQIPARLREIFSDHLLVDNKAGLLPKKRDLRLGELEVDLSIACARLNVSGGIIDVLRRLGRLLQHFTFSSLFSLTTELAAFLSKLKIQDAMQEAIANTESVVLSTKDTPDVSIIDAMTASCAFFVSYQVNSEDLFDGFYFSNLPTRVVIRPNEPANILAHQTDPFVGNSWANWFLRKIFNQTSIDILQSRFSEDEELASQHGILIYPKVQEIGSPFSASITPTIVGVGQDSLARHRFEIDRNLLKKHF